jgi:hypothetical protein
MKVIHNWNKTKNGLIQQRFVQVRPRDFSLKQLPNHLPVNLPAPPD